MHPIPDRRPGDRAYTRLHWIFFTIIAAILIYGMVVARFVTTPRAVGFRMVILLLLSFNVLWWSVADRRFARCVRSPRGSKGLRWFTAAFCLLLNAPVLLMFVTGRSVSFLSTPTWYAAAVALWHISLAAAMPLVALLRLAILAAVYAVRAALARLRGGPRPAFVADGAMDPGRRAVLRTSLATVPMVLLGGMAGASRVQERRLAVNRHEVPAPWLPRRLAGLTITHISDLHVGRHYRPYRLRELVDRVNDLDSDIVVVTGDIVDNSNDMLPPALHALGQLTHRHGLFVSIGNHDQFDNREAFIRQVRQRLPLLINQRRSIEIGGERITIAGLDYAFRDAPAGRGMNHPAHVAAALDGHDLEREGPVIALSHHPHAFDALAAAGVPMTLAGHTHGGQLMWSDPAQRPDIGVGPLLFRYNRGFYRRPAGTLFVNSGIGNWFPLRIHAPAEIVQIQLT